MHLKDAQDRALRVVNSLFLNDNSGSIKSSVLTRFLHRLNFCDDKNKYPIINSFCMNFNSAKTIIDDIINKSVILHEGVTYKPNLTYQTICNLIEGSQTAIRFYPVTHLDKQITQYSQLLHEQISHYHFDALLEIFATIKNHPLFVESRTLYKECSTKLQNEKKLITAKNQVILVKTNDHIKRKKALIQFENDLQRYVEKDIYTEFAKEDILAIQSESSFSILKTKIKSKEDQDED